MNKNTLQIFQIDAFTSEVFKGNPACVMPLEQWLPEQVRTLAITVRPS